MWEFWRQNYDPFAILEFNLRLHSSLSLSASPNRSKLDHSLTLSRFDKVMVVTYFFLAHLITRQLSRMDD